MLDFSLLLNKSLTVSGLGVGSGVDRDLEGMKWVGKLPATSPEHLPEGPASVTYSNENTPFREVRGGEINSESKNYQV